MNVFIVWGKERSHEIARGLKRLLETTIQGPSYFISDDISGGKRWSYVLADQLDKTDVGIVCLTPENLNERWLHFEAGAIVKFSKSANLIPYLYQLAPSDIEQPLADFQCRLADQEGTRKLVLQIAHLCNNQKEDVARHIFDNLAWKEFNLFLNKLHNKNYNRGSVQKNDESKIDKQLKQNHFIEQENAICEKDHCFSRHFWYVVPANSNCDDAFAPLIDYNKDSNRLEAYGYKDGTILIKVHGLLLGLSPLSESEIKNEFEKRKITAVRI